MKLTYPAIRLTTTGTANIQIFLVVNFSVPEIELEKFKDFQVFLEYIVGVAELE